MAITSLKELRGKTISSIKELTYEEGGSTEYAVEITLTSGERVYLQSQDIYEPLVLVNKQEIEHMENQQLKAEIEQVLRGFRALTYVSSVKVVGSYAKGGDNPKDIDVLMELNLTDSTLWKTKRKVKSKIVSILKLTSQTIPFDIFIITSDKKDWRLRPWEDITTKVRTYEWE